MSSKDCQYVIVLLGLVIVLSLLTITDAAAKFIYTPQRPLYVVKGKTGKLVWTYSVDNRNTDFKPYSPEWFYKDYLSEKVIGSDNGFNGWKFQLTNSTCPRRLLSPKVRVSLQNQATLVIKDLILADSGTYGCSLLLRSGIVLTSTVELIVTEAPTFVIKPTTITTAVEKSDLRLNCTAVGPPTPNVTWVDSVTGATIAKGTGSVMLLLVNITRNLTGKKYECHAMNNPNEPPINTSTTLAIYYPPEFTLLPQNTTVTKGDDVILHCQATGNPTAFIMWSRENSLPLKTGYKRYGNGSIVIPRADKTDTGIYICIAQNYFSKWLHRVASYAYVTLNFVPGQPNISVSNIEASSLTITWTKPAYIGSGPITGYKITIGSRTIPVDSISRSYIVGGLTMDTEYTVKMHARNLAGFSKASSLTFRTKKQGPPLAPVLTNYEYVSTTSIKLTWSKPDENGGEITQYTIYKKAVAVDSWWKQVGRIYGSPLTYTVKNLKPGTTYRFIVTATNAYGESVKDDSKALTVSIPIATTLPAPTTFISQNKTTCSRSSQEGDCQGVVVGAWLGASFLILSLIFNVLLLVYIYRNREKLKKTNESTYDEVEMKTNAARSFSHSNTAETYRDPSVTYEPVAKPRAKSSAPNQPIKPAVYANTIPENDQSNQDHYQQLNPATLQHDPTVQYEPLHIKHVTGTDLRNDTYEPLRNRPSQYQSLQKPSNVNNTSFS